jgi:hypothetical protein
MKVLRNVLFVLLSVFLICDSAFALKLNKDDNMVQSEKSPQENLRSTIKKIVATGYKVGFQANSIQVCEDRTKNAANEYAKGSNNKIEESDKVFFTLFYKSCVQGFNDSLKGEYNLPEILLAIDKLSLDKSPR